MALTGEVAARIYAQWHLGDPTWADDIRALLNSDEPERILLATMDPEDIELVRKEVS